MELTTVNDGGVKMLRIIAKQKLTCLLIYLLAYVLELSHREAGTQLMCVYDGV